MKDLDSNVFIKVINSSKQVLVVLFMIKLYDLVF